MRSYISQYIVIQNISMTYAILEETTSMHGSRIVISIITNKYIIHVYILSAHALAGVQKLPNL